MEMNPFEWKIILSAELCCFEKLCARHAKLAVMLSRFCMCVMRVDGNAWKKTKPKIYVTLSVAKSLVRRGRDSSVAVLPQNDMNPFEFRQIINNNCSRIS